MRRFQTPWREIAAGIAALLVIATLGLVAQLLLGAEVSATFYLGVSAAYFVILMFAMVDRLERDRQRLRAEVERLRKELDRPKRRRKK